MFPESLQSVVHNLKIIFFSESKIAILTVVEPISIPSINDYKYLYDIPSL